MFHEKTELLRRTGFVTSELFYWHDTLNWCGFFPPTLTIQPGEHVENPETKRRLHNLIAATGLEDRLVSLKPDAASEDTLRMVHPQSHIDHVRKVCENGGGDTGILTPGGLASFDIARLAVGGVTGAIDAVVSGDVDNAYVLCRPPGHHATHDTSMGFCIFANAAIGAKHAQKHHGVKRIATVDWDVHHGNGTEAIFKNDPSVLTISLHQDRLFPHDTGGVEDNGEDKQNLNIPLPPGSGAGAYRHAFEELVIPALEAFEPELILVPCGYDPAAFDPLGVQMLSSADFRWMTQRLVDFAETQCEGRLIVTHEGGYSAMYVPYCGIAVVEALCGASAAVEDPFEPFIETYAGQELNDQQAAAIAAARDAYFKA